MPIRWRRIALQGNRRTIDRLREGLAQLDPAQRAVLSMFYLDEMSIQEIADACSVPLGTVKSRLFYARSHLKHVLKREDQ